MLCEPGIAVDDMGFPQDRGQVLRSPSDRGHGECLLFFIVGIIEVVFAFPEVYQLYLIAGEEEDVGGLDIPVADASALEVRASRHQAAVHGHEFLLVPVLVGFLFFTVDGFEVGLGVDVLGEDAQLEAVLLGFAEVVAVEFDDVGVVLHFCQLGSLLLVLVELVKIFGFYFFEGVYLVGADMDSFVYFGVFFA